MKKVSHITSFILILMMGMVMILSPSFIAHAENNPVMTISNVESKEKTEVSNAFDNANSDLSKLGMEDFLVVSEDENSDKNINIEIDMQAYNRLSQEKKKQVMGIALNAIETSGVSKINRGKIYNFIANNDKSTSNLVRQLSDDVTADYVNAYSVFKPFTGFIGIVLGCVTLAIFICLALTIVFDLAYIVIPVWQEFLNTHTDKEKPKLTSLEAWSAVREAEKGAGNEFREPLGIYFKTKAKQFIIMGICLLYLVSGKIYVLIAYIMDAFSGVLPN